jgi:hypothetical protein
MLVSMRRMYALILLLVCAFSGWSAPVPGARIVKVLPHYLDMEGLHAISPSLYDRDAYQDVLRQHPAKCSAIRFDVQWKAVDVEGVTVKVEIRGNKTTALPVVVLEQPLKKISRWGKWTALTTSREQFASLGSIVAWRVTFWQNGQQISEQKSFLW